MSVGNHLPALPILLPMVTAAVMLLFERRGFLIQRLLATLSMAVLLSLAVSLVQLADSGAITVYLVGDWAARLGIPRQARPGIRRKARPRVRRAAGRTAPSGIRRRPT